MKPIPVYVVRIGGRLYAKSEFYSFYQATTNDILSAKLFQEYARAAKVAKAAHGEVVELVLAEPGSDTEEVEMLRAAVTQLRKERDNAIEELKLYKEAKDV